MTGEPTRRIAPMVALALVTAAAGGAAALGIAAAAGWVGGAETVVVSPGGSRQELIVSPSGGAAAEGSTGAPATAFDPAELYRERSPGVVTIYARYPGHEGTDGAGVGQGSGFVVSPDGYILTNSHVITTSGAAAEEFVPPTEVEAATDVYVEFADGDRVEAEIVGWDLYYDVGVVKVDPEEHELVTVPLGDSSEVEVGEPVAAIGSPYDQGGSLAVGVVSGTERSVPSLTSTYNVIDAIQTDAPINRGNSGGPLFDAQGEVIGINAQIRSDSGNAEGVGFAIPINVARQSMEQLIETGEARYAWVGVSTRTLTPSLAAAAGASVEQGAAIECVVPGSPAAEAGLRAGGREVTAGGLRFFAGGDIVVAINEDEVATSEDLGRIVATSLRPGETASFTVVRGAERVALAVVLGERPGEAGGGC